MSYKLGKQLSLVDAMKTMVDGGVTLYCGCAPCRFSNRGFEIFQEQWVVSDVWLTNSFYEAIEVPEYNLNFMEAWEEMKKGKTVESNEGRKLAYRSGYVSQAGGYVYSGGDLYAHEKTLDAKYRVVEGA